MDKQIAYRKVRAAITSGALVRPAVCERCSCMPGLASDGRAKIQAHHADYSKPLDVEWICAKCHREETPLPERPGAPTPGERNGQAKLSEKDVVSARRLRQQGMIYRLIAERFGVDKRTIMRAIKGEQWAHVDRDAQQMEGK